MQKIFYIISFLLISFTYSSQTSADSSYFEPQYKRGINYTVKTRHGAIYTGYVKEETKEFVVFENRMTRETVELRKTEILTTSQSKERDLTSEVLGENLHAKNYLLLSSAFPYEKGKVTTNSHWLLLENIDYAITDNWAINLNTLAFYPVALGIKCAYQLNDDNYIGANVFGIGNIASGNSSSLLFGYCAQGRFTKGNSNKNFTVSGGILGLNSDLFYTASNSSFTNLGFVSAAYCNRFSKKVALTLEGWYLPATNAGLAGAGFKFVSDEIFCWTFGCYALLNSYDNTVKLNLKTLPIPYFGVSRKFN